MQSALHLSCLPQYHYKRQFGLGHQVLITTPKAIQQTKEKLIQYDTRENFLQSKMYDEQNYYQRKNEFCQIAKVEGEVTNVQQDSSLAGIGLIAAGLLLISLAIKKIYDTPSRTYNENVGDEYDAWTSEGILEYYWGEHIHLGYYDDHERSGWLWKKNFKQAKYDFVDKMLEWSGAENPKTILDVGCGFGGTSRYLARKFPNSKIVGITLSPKQVERGTQLAKVQGLTNVEFRVLDALNMVDFEDNKFELVWACESGEHMPDKQKYIDEMTRVLKPEGNIVIACWCQRDAPADNPLTKQDKENLQFLYEEWAHPYFISINDFCNIMEGTGKLQSVGQADWSVQTLPSWRQSVWVGVVDPWYWLSKVSLWYKCTRDAVCLERMHRAFARGLMQYGMMRAVKKSQVSEEQSIAIQDTEFTTAKA